MTLENKQDNVMSVELLFARQLIPSSNLNKLHHPSHWTRASSRFLQPSPTCLPRQWQRWCWSQNFRKFTAGLNRSPRTQRTCWMTNGYSTCRELRQKNLTLLRRQTGPLQSSKLQQQVTAGAATEPNHRNQSTGLTS